MAFRIQEPSIQTQSNTLQTSLIEARDKLTQYASAIEEMKRKAQGASHPELQRLISEADKQLATARQIIQENSKRFETSHPVLEKKAADTLVTEGEDRELLQTLRAVAEGLITYKKQITALQIATTIIEKAFVQERIQTIQKLQSFGDLPGAEEAKPIKEETELLSLQIKMLDLKVHAIQNARAPDLKIIEDRMALIETAIADAASARALDAENPNRKKIELRSKDLGNLVEAQRQASMNVRGVSSINPEHRQKHFNNLQFIAEYIATNSHLAEDVLKPFRDEYVSRKKYADALNSGNVTTAEHAHKIMKDEITRIWQPASPASKEKRSQLALPKIKEKVIGSFTPPITKQQTLKQLEIFLIAANAKLDSPEYQGLVDEYKLRITKLRDSISRKEGSEALNDEQIRQFKLVTETHQIIAEIVRISPTPGQSAEAKSFFSKEFEGYQAQVRLISTYWDTDPNSRSIEENEKIENRKKAYENYTDALSEATVAYEQAELENNLRTKSVAIMIERIAEARLKLELIDPTNPKLNIFKEYSDYYKRNVDSKDEIIHNMQFLQSLHDYLNNLTPDLRLETSIRNDVRKLKEPDISLQADAINRIDRELQPGEGKNLRLAKTVLDSMVYTLAHQKEPDRSKSKPALALLSDLLRIQVALSGTLTHIQADHAQRAELTAREKTLDEKITQAENLLKNANKEPRPAGYDKSLVELHEFSRTAAGWLKDLERIHNANVGTFNDELQKVQRTGELRDVVLPSAFSLRQPADVYEFLNAQDYLQDLKQLQTVAMQELATRSDEIAINFVPEKELQRAKEQIAFIKQYPDLGDRINDLLEKYVQLQQKAQEITIRSADPLQRIQKAEQINQLRQEVKDLERELSKATNAYLNEYKTSLKLKIGDQINQLKLELEKPQKLSLESLHQAIAALYIVEGEKNNVDSAPDFNTLNRIAGLIEEYRKRLQNLEDTRKDAPETTIRQRKEFIDQLLKGLPADYQSTQVLKEYSVSLEAKMREEVSTNLRKQLLDINTRINTVNSEKERLEEAKRTLEGSKSNTAEVDKQISEVDDALKTLRESSQKIQENFDRSIKELNAFRSAQIEYTVPLAFKAEALIAVREASLQKLRATQGQIQRRGVPDSSPAELKTIVSSEQPFQLRETGLNEISRLNEVMLRDIKRLHALTQELETAEKILEEPHHTETVSRLNAEIENIKDVIPSIQKRIQDVSESTLREEMAIQEGLNHAAEQLKASVSTNAATYRANRERIVQFSTQADTARQRLEQAERSAPPATPEATLQANRAIETAILEYQTKAREADTQASTYINSIDATLTKLNDERIALIHRIQLAEVLAKRAQEDIKEGQELKKQNASHPLADDLIANGRQQSEYYGNLATQLNKAKEGNIRFQAELNQDRDNATRYLESLRKIIQTDLPPKLTQAQRNIQGAERVIASEEARRKAEAEAKRKADEEQAKQRAEADPNFKMRDELRVANERYQQAVAASDRARQTYQNNHGARAAELTLAKSQNPRNEPQIEALETQEKTEKEAMAKARAEVVSAAAARENASKAIFEDHRSKFTEAARRHDEATNREPAAPADEIARLEAAREAARGEAIAARDVYNQAERDANRAVGEGAREERLLTAQPYEQDIYGRYPLMDEMTGTDLNNSALSQAYRPLLLHYLAVASDAHINWHLRKQIQSQDATDTIQKCETDITRYIATARQRQAGGENTAELTEGLRKAEELMAIIESIHIAKRRITPDQTSHVTYGSGPGAPVRNMQEALAAVSQHLGTPGQPVPVAQEGFSLAGTRPITTSAPRDTTEDYSVRWYPANFQYKIGNKDRQVVRGAVIQVETRGSFITKPIYAPDDLKKFKDLKPRTIRTGDINVEIPNQILMQEAQKLFLTHVGRQLADGVDGKNIIVNQPDKAPPGLIEALMVIAKKEGYQLVANPASNRMRNMQTNIENPNYMKLAEEIYEREKTILFKESGIPTAGQTIIDNLKNTGPNRPAAPAPAPAPAAPAPGPGRRPA